MAAAAARLRETLDQESAEKVSPLLSRLVIKSIEAGVAQEGGGGGYHCPGAAGYPKLGSTLEIPAPGQVGQFCCFLLPVLAHSGQ